MKLVIGTANFLKKYTYKDKIVSEKEQGKIKTTSLKWAIKKTINNSFKINDIIFVSKNTGGAAPQQLVSHCLLLAVFVRGFPRARPLGALVPRSPRALHLRGYESASYTRHRRCRC